ncbi:Vacuolar protein sorting-associated protein vps5 [Malassezia obtusa]|uniref:Vacuolar protein sorting-associated protein vps5 n=1 Tax=Malassezia obtusa TaxID=76774 RepID=A0AAF0IRQ9_9BASI|nr:Vacuolar protein sorting-associated protein vps5 [Malassezia obtusa]
MRLLVTGASGLLGRAVVHAARAREHEVVGIAHTRAHGGLRALDLTDRDALHALVAEVQPDAVIHTAAERRPDAMEAHPDAAHALNVTVPAEIAAACAALARPARLVHVSTDYVFDGAAPPYKPEDTPNPLNAYGRSKRDAERALADARPGTATSVRVPVLYGETEYDAESAVNVLLTALQTSKPTKMDAHGTRYPTNVADVARFLVALCEHAAPLPPILHFSAPEPMTKYDMSCRMARAWNRACGREVVTTDHLVPETTPAPSATQRPGNCHLDTQASAALGVSLACVEFDAWWEAYLRRRGPPGGADRASDRPESTGDGAGRAGAAPAPSDDDEARYGARSPTDAPADAPSDPPGEPAPSFSVRVCNPQRVSDRVSSHVVYTVRVTTDAPWLGKELVALRRYSEFRWLHAALVHNHPGVIVPSIPEKVKLNNMHPELVEFRRRALEQALHKMLQHPLLQRDEDLVLFLESANLSAAIKARDALKGPVVTPEQKTYLGWSQSLYNVRFRETDDWFNQQLDYLAQLEARLHDIVAAVHTLAQRRQELADAQHALYRHLVTLSGGSLSRSVSTCFGALAELKKRSAETATALAQHEAQVLGLVFHEYERLIGNVRKAFATRVDVWHAWQRADDDLAKLKARHRRASHGHLDAQMHAVSNAELVSAALQSRFEDVSALCKKEMQRFEQEKVADLRAALAEYVHAFQRTQQETVDELAHCEAIVQRHVRRAVGPPPGDASADASRDAAADVRADAAPAASDAAQARGADAPSPAPDHAPRPADAPDAPPSAAAPAEGAAETPAPNPRPQGVRDTPAREPPVADASA